MLGCVSAASTRRSWRKRRARLASSKRCLSSLTATRRSRRVVVRPGTPRPCRPRPAARPPGIRRASRRAGGCPLRCRRGPRHPAAHRRVAPGIPRRPRCAAPATSLSVKQRVVVPAGFGEKRRALAGGRSSASPTRSSSRSCGGVGVHARSAWEGRGSRGFTQFPVQPGAGELPVAVHGAAVDLQHLGDVAHLHAAKEAQFDDLAGPPVAPRRGGRAQYRAPPDRPPVPRRWAALPGPRPRRAARAVDLPPAAGSGGGGRGPRGCAALPGRPRCRSARGPATKPTCRPPAAGRPSWTRAVDWSVCRRAPAACTRAPARADARRPPASGVRLRRGRPRSRRAAGRSRRGWRRCSYKGTRAQRSGSLSQPASAGKQTFSRKGCRAGDFSTLSLENHFVPSTSSQHPSFHACSPLPSARRRRVAPRRQRHRQPRRRPRPFSASLPARRARVTRPGPPARPTTAMPPTTITSPCPCRPA